MGWADFMNTPDLTRPRANRASIRLAAAMGALLLAGGVLLDMDRVMAVRDTLNRVAGAAAIAAAAEARPIDQAGICQRRFDKHVWTETDVTVDELSVAVSETKTGRLSTVDYDATVKLVVGRYFGFSEFEISGQVSVPLPRKTVIAGNP
jgi:uncharacterized membrane protein